MLEDLNTPRVECCRTGFGTEDSHWGLLICKIHNPRSGRPLYIILLFLNRYLLKPEHTRRKDRRFDPFVDSMVDGVIAGTVHVKVLSP